MLKIMVIGFGGFFGAVMRYLVSNWVQNASTGGKFPWGTLTVNMVGCLLIGVLLQTADTKAIFTETARNFLFMGFLGAFTTFSTFGNDTVVLLQDGRELAALGNIFLHLSLGLLAVYLGRYSVNYLVS